MGERKHEVERPYPPDYVSAETLAIGSIFALNG